MGLRSGTGGVAAAAAVMLLLGTGCAVRPVTEAPAGADPVALVSGCCADVEVYPEPLIRMVEPKAEDKPAFDTSLRVRPPYLLDRPGAAEFVLRHLRPLDILLTSDKGQVSGRLMVGYMTHSLVYLGTEAQLRAAGLWDHPDLVPLQARVRAGEIFYESTPPQVDLNPAERVLNVDAVSIWRPRLTRAEQRLALGRLLRERGKPFDRLMESRTSDCLYCAELLDIGFPELGLRHRLAYGHDVVIPDEIAADAIRGRVPLEFVGYVHGTAAGRVVSAPLSTLAATIAQYWPPRPDGANEKRGAPVGAPPEVCVPNEISSCSTSRIRPGAASSRSSRALPS